MTNNPQSSRRTALQSIMPKINIASLNTSKTFSENNSPDYFVTGTPTNNGQTDIKFNKRETASNWHYLVIAGAIGVALYMMNKKIGEF